MTKGRKQALGALVLVVLGLGLFLAWSRGMIGKKEVLHIYAASSLTEAFRELATTYEAIYPRTDVELTFAGSQVLRLQIEQGAEADLFASAEYEQIWELQQAGWAEDQHAFAYNDLAVVVPLDNPAGIESFEDLPRAERIVIGARSAPIGEYTRKALRKAGLVYGAGFEMQVMSHVVSEESNVRLVRAKVELGEADAAIVYATDAAASDRVLTIPVPGSVNTRAEYWFATIRPFTAGPPSRAAERWVARLMGVEGREALFHAGFTFRE